MPEFARIAVIGAGWWGSHVYIPALLEHPEAQLVAVNRPDREALDRLTATFGVRGYTDFRDLLAEERPDGVVVSSPHVLHFEHALAALEQGAHVLVDKPMTTFAGDARRLVAEAERRGLQVVIPYGWNFKDFTRRAADLVAAG